MINQETLVNCELNYLLEKDIDCILKAQDFKHCLLYTGISDDKLEADFNMETK